MYHYHSYKETAKYNDLRRWQNYLSSHA